MTSSRVSAYSDWRRGFGNNCYCVDIDYCEVREGRGIVALIAETGRLENEQHLINSKPMIWARSGVERLALSHLACKCQVPAFYVIHTEDLTVFHVCNIYDFNDYKKMNKEEYEKFIREL